MPSSYHVFLPNKHPFTIGHIQFTLHPPFLLGSFLLASLPGSYNGGDSTISLNGKFAIQIYREDATQPSETAALAGTVNPGEFFIVCNDAEVFNTVYNGECSEEVSTILSDGDDVVSLVQLVVENGALNLVPSDVYGTIGESGESKHLILYLYAHACTCHAPKSSAGID